VDKSHEFGKYHFTSLTGSVLPQRAGQYRLLNQTTKGLKMKKIGKFNVHIINDGDKYGLRDCLTHTGEAMIEFYDSRFVNDDQWKRGQFVSRYYISSLVGKEGGLQLDGGVHEWHITPEQMQDVQKLIA